VDNKNKELYARIFDIGITGEDAEISKTGGSVSSGQDVIAKLQGSREIRYVVPCFSDIIKEDKAKLQFRY
jgi:hypothetical protein